MAIVLVGRTRSFRFNGTTTLEKLRVKITETATRQVVLPSQGITDVVDGVLIQPISAKYPGLGLIRWVNASGLIQGVEQRIEFEGTDFFPPSTACTGFEIFVTQGTVFDVEIFNGESSMNLTDYYTKTEVDDLFSTVLTNVDAYINTQIEAKALTLSTVADTYTKSQVNALSEVSLKGFTYDQVAVPTNPQLGDTWKERNADGAILMDWYYNNSTVKWLSFESKSIMADISSNAEVETRDRQLEQKSNYNYFFDYFAVNYIPYGNINAANYHRLFLFFLNNDSSNFFVMRELSSATAAQGQPKTFTALINTVVPVNEIDIARLAIIRQGNAGSYASNLAVSYRYQRA